MSRRSAFAPDTQHVGIDVAHRRLEAASGGIGGAESDVAGAAGNGEQCEWRVGARRVQRIDQKALPNAMQARRHQVVHQVVALRHAVKDVIDQRLLVAQGDVPEAEMRGLVRLVHRIYSNPGPYSAPAAMALSRQCLKVNAPLCLNYPKSRRFAVACNRPWKVPKS